jgi:hypothetical protein
MASESKVVTIALLEDLLPRLEQWLTDNGFELVPFGDGEFIIVPTDFRLGAVPR